MKLVVNLRINQTFRFSPGERSQQKMSISEIRNDSEKLNKVKSAKKDVILRSLEIMNGLTFSVRRSIGNQWVKIPYRWVNISGATNHVWWSFSHDWKVLKVFSRWRWETFFFRIACKRHQKSLQLHKDFTKSKENEGKTIWDLSVKFYQDFCCMNQNKNEFLSFAIFRIMTLWHFSCFLPASACTSQISVWIFHSNYLLLIYKTFTNR